MPRLTTLALGAAVAALAACADERPPISDADHDDGTPPSVKEQPVEPTIASTRCIPGEARECKMTFIDAFGIKHCPSATQYCRATGLGWLGCGAPAEPASSALAADAEDDPDDADAGARPW